MLTRDVQGSEMTRRQGSFLAAVAATVVLLVAPAQASAASEWGSTTKWPWTGYWWPMLNSYLNNYDDGQSMQLYDQYLEKTGRPATAQAWEKQNHFTTEAKNDWWGHCHAWAAAAILTKEPPAQVNRQGIDFHTNAVRGLVTELYYQPTYNWLAGRRNDGNDRTSEAYKDVAPAWMDWLLRNYVGYYHYPFIMDISADSQVWNFPAFAYTRDSTKGADGTEHVKTRVWYANAVAGATGTQYFSRLYTYDIKPGQLGTWTGNSVDDHPDFAWMPTGKNAMPNVKETVVEEIIGNGYNA